MHYTWDSLVASLYLTQFSHSLLHSSFRLLLLLPFFNNSHVIFYLQSKCSRALWIFCHKIGSLYDLTPKSMLNPRRHWPASHLFHSLYLSLSTSLSLSLLVWHLDCLLYLFIPARSLAWFVIFSFLFSIEIF